MTGDLTKNEMEDVLHGQLVGYLGLSLRDEPYVVPVTFVYRDSMAYGHTYEGQKVEMMRANPRACLTVTEITDLGHWRSVVCHGACEELDGKDAQEAIDLLLSKLSAQPDAAGVHLPLPVDGVSVGARTGEHPVFYRLRIRTMTGRFENR